MTYVFAYFLRNNYAVALPALLEKTGISRELGGLPITASFISYGIGQIVFGLCGDHLPPGKMIACGWTITILSNILLPLLLPLFNIIITSVSLALARRIRNEIKSIMILGIFCALSAGFLHLFLDRSVVLTITLLILVAGFTNSMNVIGTVNVPARYHSINRVSSISGVTNSAVYIGSAVSVWGIAKLSVDLGWHFTTAMWFYLALGLTVIAALAIRIWTAFIRKI
ncbi:MAG: hypothetical protein GX900_00485 [Clostridiaceae bacterium]|nr:hypothetical protein [Clostridiaceae bacterium]